MPKITDEPLVMRQIRLYRADYEYLQKMYANDVGVNRVIRTLVHTYVNNIKANASRTIDKIEGTETDDTAESNDNSSIGPPTDAA